MGRFRLIKMLWSAFLLVSSLGFSSSREPTDTMSKQSRSYSQLLESWAGKDISKLDKSNQDSFTSFLKSGLIPDKPQNDFEGFNDAFFYNKRDNAYVWKLSSSPESPFIIYLCGNVGESPSAAYAVLAIVDHKGKRIISTQFDIGWRGVPVGTGLQSLKGIRTPVIVQHIGGGEGYQGPPVITIGFDGFRPVVLRTQDAKGRFFRIDYWNWIWVVGPPSKFERHPEKVLPALVSGDKVKELEALSWLAGRRALPAWLPKSHKFSKDNSSYMRLMQDSKVREVVKILRVSSDADIQPVASKVPISDNELRDLASENYY